MLCGLLVPTEGDLEVCGERPADRSYSFLSRISVIFGQKAMLWWDVSTRESLRIHRSMYEISRDDFAATVVQLGDLLGITDILDTPVRHLSLGQRMRCELALALLHRPTLLFADEPTIGLDVEAKVVVRDLFREINRTFGTAIVLTSHDMKDVEALSDRVVIIKDGSAAFDGDLAELRAHADLPAEVVLTYRDIPHLPAELAHDSTEDGARSVRLRLGIDRCRNYGGPRRGEARVDGLGRAGQFRRAPRPAPAQQPRRGPAEVEQGGDVGAHRTGLGVGGRPPGVPPLVPEGRLELRGARHRRIDRAERRNALEPLAPVERSDDPHPTAGNHRSAVGREDLREEQQGFRGDVGQGPRRAAGDQRGPDTAVAHVAQHLDVLVEDDVPGLHQRPVQVSDERSHLPARSRGVAARAADRTGTPRTARHRPRRCAAPGRARPAPCPTRAPATASAAPRAVPPSPDPLRRPTRSGGRRRGRAACAPFASSADLTFANGHAHLAVLCDPTTARIPPGQGDRGGHRDQFSR
jgi:ABC-2 type transport system ATP-binding protein